MFLGSEPFPVDVIGKRGTPRKKIIQQVTRQASEKTTSRQRKSTKGPPAKVDKNSGK